MQFQFVATKEKHIHLNIPGRKMMRRLFSTGRKLTKATIVPVPVNLGQPNMGLDSAPK